MISSGTSPDYSLPSEKQLSPHGLDAVQPEQIEADVVKEGQTLMMGGGEIPRRRVEYSSVAPVDGSSQAVGVGPNYLLQHAQLCQRPPTTCA